MKARGRLAEAGRAGELTLEQARQLCQQLLAAAGGAPSEVYLLDEQLALTRFAGNAIHQNVAERNQRAWMRVRLGTRVGEAAINRLDPGGLAELAARARGMAALATEDGDLPELAGEQAYPEAIGFDADTAEMAPAARAAAVGQACALAARQSVGAYGAFSTGAQRIAVANSSGLFAYQPTTLADFQVRAMDTDSSGQAQASSWRAGDLDVAGLAEEAVRKAVEGRGPRAIEAGSYVVVLDPYATHDLLYMLNLYGIGGRSHLEGRSWMNGREGQPAMAPSVHLADDPVQGTLLPRAFDGEGTPARRVEIVAGGVVRRPVYDRRTAALAGAETTAHATAPFGPTWLRSLGPLAGRLVLEPGEVPTQQLIRDTRRGLYITRFWYTRLVHPKDCVVTGMTRDGVFAIEDGEIAYPVKNLRFTQSYVEALAQVEALGSEARVILHAEEGLATLSPALRLAAFHFTGSTV